MAIVDCFNVQIGTIERGVVKLTNDRTTSYLRNESRLPCCQRSSNRLEVQLSLTLDAVLAGNSVEIGSGKLKCAAWLDLG